MKTQQGSEPETNARNVLLIPIAGFGSRFKSVGYTLPKQMLPLGGDSLTCLEESLDSIEVSHYRIIFILRRAQLEEDGFDLFLSKLDCDFEIVILEEPTRGSVESCLAAESIIDPDDNLTIFTMDVSFRPKLQPSAFPSNVDGGVLTFKSNSRNYSYVRTEGDAVVAAEEKLPISDKAVVGIYYFRSAGVFFKEAKAMLEQGLTTLGEYYLAPMYNQLIEKGLFISHTPVDQMNIFGTPEEYTFYKNHGIKSHAPHKVIGLASDHSGWEMKAQLKKILQDQNVKIVDYGCFSSEATDYSDHIQPAVEAMLRDEVDYVFGSCDSGQGANLAAMANHGVIGTVIYDREAARTAVSHNCANFFSFPQRVWRENPEELAQAVAEILDQQFAGGRHQLRVSKVLANQRRGDARVL
jgi:RpiB/LacA/LacB family sugar-phosphate isomerase